MKHENWSPWTLDEWAKNKCEYESMTKKERAEYLASKTPEELDVIFIGWQKDPRDEEVQPFEDVKCGFCSYTKEQQDEILQYVKEMFTPIKSYNYNTSSYGIKHGCERKLGYYISNNCMKVAMYLGGYMPDNAFDINHCYTISKKSPYYKSRFIK